MATTVTLDRKPILGDSTFAKILLNTILFGKKQGWYYLLSFVIMSNHIHLVVIPKGKNVSECMKSIKGFSARRINEAKNERGSIWQSGFWDYILESEEKVLNRIRYIEENPVRKGIVECPEDYEYSSARYKDETDFERFFNDKIAGLEIST